MSDRASKLQLTNTSDLPINPSTEEKQDDIISALWWPEWVVDTPAFFEDTSFVAGDSPITIDFNTALGRNATQWWIKNDGNGEFKISFSTDSIIFWDEITIKIHEVYKWDQINVDSLRITWVSNSSYRALAI